MKSALKINNKIFRIIGDTNIKNIKLLDKGVSNINYLVNDKYVVRIKEYYDRYYNYKYELEINHAIADLYISDRVIYLDKDGNKISDYIKETTTFNNTNKEIVQIANILKKLHESNIKVKAQFNALSRFSYYKNKANLKEFKHEKELLKKIRKIYKKYDYVLCHNDLVKDNFLFTNKKCYLIDYEYAGNNIKLFDLASFISENNIVNKKKIQLFLDTYKINNEEKEDLKYMIMFLNLLWYYWAIEKYKVTKKDVFLKISEIKKKNILKDIKILNITVFS